jgi:ADP-ribosyl-[dinitrogen reductase] hydrolase
MLGAIIGDIVGSIYEFQNHRSKAFPLFDPKADFTDDTVCTVALADALLRNADPAATLRAWCRRYPGRGYGGMFRRWIDDDSLGRYNSFGNGAAMRVSAAALLGIDLRSTLLLADRITEITHDHPEGMKGARATVTAIWLARAGESVDMIRAMVAQRFGYDMGRTVDDIRPRYVFNETCQETVPEALICALEATDFEDAIRNAISIGGDSDTVACIAGGVAEARFGIPAAIAAEGVRWLPQEMVDVVWRVYRKAGLEASLPLLGR